MKATTLTEAVSQIIGKPASEEFAKEYVLNHYMEFRMFTRHEDNIIRTGIENLNKQKLKRERFKKMYSKN